MLEFATKMTAAFRKTMLLALLATTAAVAQTVPAELPRPDDTPPSKDKPVKIYICSGQSNSLGFGRATGGSPTFPSIYLSPDPTIKTTAMPVGSSGLLPMDVFRSATGDERSAQASVYKGNYAPKTGLGKLEHAIDKVPIALGDVSESLPSIDGPHTVLLKAAIEVPITGDHEVHIGDGDSSHAIATINGREVYRKEIDGDAKQTKIRLEKGKRHALEIIYLKGGSATFWMELVDLKPQGTLEQHVKEGRFTCLVDKNGEWNTRNDVMICDAYMGKGKNGPLTAMWRNGSFGPELGFGYVMGTFHDEPVIVMKADIGNRSLGWDCLPPGSKRFEAEVTDRKTGKTSTHVFAGYKDSQSSWPKDQDGPRPSTWYAGKQYDEYTASIHNVLNNFDTLFPQYKDRGYEVAGFVWWQGHKDQNPVHASKYEENLVNLIKAWRREFKAPKAKFAVSTIAFGGWKLSGPGKTIAEAQLAVGSGKYPGFEGNVKTIEARDFWRDAGESPKNQDYHYNHNGETYFLVGDALGRAMVEMQGGKAEPRQLAPRPKKPESWPKKPTLEQAAQMLYSDGFISKWGKDPAKPTPADFEKMAPALRPIIIGKLIPSYIAKAPGTPAYRRRGAPIMPLITGEPPKKPGSVLSNQLDNVIEYYNAAGVRDYDWKRFGPDMQNATWQYFSFEPAEKPDPKSTNQYRKVTSPEGMNKWFAADFDPAKADWKTGQAPFGQDNGERKALRPDCNNPQCGCDLDPKTLWEKDVLLMRQTFELPKLKKDHRYRLVVGGGNHGFSGEGFAVYVNGKLFIESPGGFYKSGGTSGGYVYNDFLPDFESGKVTIAVKSFLRRTRYVKQPGPPRGHLSVWLEEAQLPPSAIKLADRK